ncbi:unnamed protein product [Mytilus coruscus]|uniref:Uncharacterized protein n=1 Tax=Mytilus coruscus TaxID=42192 RepID=A0A6J8DSY4_MYTCO|nr:unnamed protein product [Mytilus coruscus]
MLTGHFSFNNLAIINIMQSKCCDCLTKTITSLKSKGQQSRIKETGVYESSNISSRLSDHAYDSLESAKYYNMTNVPNSSTKNGTGVSTFEEDFGGWTNKSSNNFEWERNNVITDHTRVSGGEQINTTCRDMSKPVRIECETQFLVGDIELSLEPEYKTDCQEKAIEIDLNNFCRNNFNKSEQYITDGSLESPVQYDIIGIAAGVFGGIIITIIAVVVLCRKKRSTPGKPNAISTNGNKAYDDLQHDDESQQKPSLSQSASHDKITPNNSNLTIPKQLDQDGQESADLYDMSKEDGMYDVSSSDRHRKNRNDNNIYSHTADNIYDSGSHHKLPERNEETYDHFFGQQTDDEYDTTTRT